jgi:hypothetical protein
MPITESERYESRTTTRDQGRITLVEAYTIFGTNDPSVAETYGPTWSETRSQEGYVLSVSRKHAERIAVDACRLEVTFSTPEGSDDIDGFLIESWEYDLTATREHITNVRSEGNQVSYTADAQGVTIFGTAIGVTPDGNIEGVDIFVPNDRLTCKKMWAAEEVNADFIDKIRKTTGKVNNSLFKGYKGEELLFLGARFTKQATGYIQVVYEFIGSKNKEGAELEYEDVNGQTISVTEKKGWRYLWFRIVKKAQGEGTSNLVKNGIESVSVATVYEQADFQANLQLSDQL